MNNKIIRIICVLLSIALLLSAAGCQTNTAKKKVKGGNNTIELPGDTQYITNETYEPGDEIIDYEYNYIYEDENGNEVSAEDITYDENGNPVYADSNVNEMTISNNSTPILNQSFLGASGAVYHGSTLMNDAYGRNYTEEMAQIEFDRVKEAGIKYVRTYFWSGWFWDYATETWNFDLDPNSPNYNDYFADFIRWAKEMDKRGIKIILNTGWSTGAGIAGSTKNATRTSDPSNCNECAYLNGPYVEDDANGYPNVPANATGAAVLAESETTYNKFGELDWFIGSSEYNSISAISVSASGTTKAHTITANGVKVLRERGIRNASFFARAAEIMKANGVNNIYAMLVWTEPSYWTYGQENYEGPYAAEFCENWRGFYSELRRHTALNDIKVIGPNQGSVHYAGLVKYGRKYEKSKGVKLWDIYSSHFYVHLANELNDTVYETMVDKYADYDKFITNSTNDSSFTKLNYNGNEPFWLDEWGVSSQGSGGNRDSGWDGTNMAVGLITGMKYHFNNTCKWNIFDQLWLNSVRVSDQFQSGVHATGTTPTLFESSIPRAQYYSYFLVTRYISSDGGTTYPVTNNSGTGVYMNAVKRSDGYWTIVVAAMVLAEDTHIKINFGSSINQTLYRHTYAATNPKKSTAGHLADVDRVFKDVGNVLYDTVPAGGVCVYTGCKF